MTGAAIVRSGAEPQPLALLGTNPDEVLERATELADALGRVVRDRGMALRLGDAERDFLTLHAWQVLAAFVGVVVIVEETSPLPDGSGWQARASVRTGDDRVVATGDGMCARSERNWRAAPDHSVRAMAQTRGMRRALQGALGFIPGLAGMDVADPTAPATRRQVVALHALAGDLGWDHEEAHARAGVVSFNDLKRGEAGELLETWSALVEPTRRSGAEPATLEDLWTDAIAAYGSRVAVLRASLERWPSAGGISASSLSAEDLTELLSQVPPQEGS